MQSLALCWSTPRAWAAAALAQPLELLSDHAHCELGAAASAQALIARRAADGPLVERMAAVALEELRHFRRVHRLLRRLGGELAPARPNPYVVGLQRAAGASGGDRLLDRLLVAALVERRSLERFELLAAAAQGPLAALYRELAPSEAGHAASFVALARERRSAAEVEARLAELTRLEGELARGLAFAPRIHSGPPAAAEPAAHGGGRR